MDCGVDTIETQDETGATRGIEIIPKGCEPVSEDICKSGFMAPTENVSFPENALKQCCKCKEGEACPYCENPDACTDEEKRDFITNEDCFAASVGPSSEDVPEPEPEEGGDVNIFYIIGMMLFVIIMITVMILFARRSKTVGAA
jgi:hypothetical protein